MQRTNLTESQYMELRKYEDGYPRWIAGAAAGSLASRGLLSPLKRDRTMFHITEAGLNALSAFKTRHGL
jgi:hypothetical protein